MYSRTVAHLEQEQKHRSHTAPAALLALIPLALLCSSSNSVRKRRLFGVRPRLALGSFLCALRDSCLVSACTSVFGFEGERVGVDADDADLSANREALIWCEDDL